MVEANHRVVLECKENMTRTWTKVLPTYIWRRLEEQSNHQKIISNTGWLLLDRAFRLGVGLFVSVWVARYLGPAQFGELAYVVAFVAFFQAFAQLGLDSIVIRDMARDRNAAPELLGTTLWLRLLVGFVCWGAAIGGMALLRPGDDTALLLVSIVAGTIVFQAADTVDLWFQSLTQSKRTVGAKGISYLTASLLKVALILAHAPLAAFAIVTLIEMALSALALVFAYRRYPAPFAWTWHASRVRELLRESWPLLLSGAAVVIYMRIDQIMLREMVGEAELGIYSAALSISQAWYFIPMVICSSVAPTISRKKVESEEAYLSALQRLFGLMLMISLTVSIAIALIAQPVVNLLYGAAYSATAAVLAIHVFANVPVSLGVAQSLWITNERRPTFALYRTVLGCVANIVLNFLLIPKYGATGAAIATLAAQFLAAVVYNFFAARDVLILQFRSMTNWAK